MKRHATTIVLLLLAVGLGLWLWRDRDAVTEGERKRRENNVFTAWRREDLSRIEIAHEGETIVLEREAKQDGSWRMTSPRKERVDQAAAERLITTLEFATVVRKVGDVARDEHEKESAALGLDAPRATGSITMGSVVFRYALGATSPRPPGSAYFRVDGGPPFVASRELTDTLLAPADTYRDRTVVPYLSLEMARFEVKHAGGGFVVERSDARSFKVQGLGVLASRAALDNAWGALAEMRAEAFPKDADADRLTAHPRLTIVIIPKEGGKPPGEIVIGEACPGHPNDVVVLRTRPTRVAACAPKGALDALLAITPEALIDRRPFSFRHDEIEELRLEKLAADGDGADASAAGASAAPRVIELARRGTGFHQREPADRELAADEAEAVSEWLSQIEHGLADDVRAGAGAPPFVAAFRARVRSGENDELIEIGAVTAQASDAGVPGVPVRRLRDDARLTMTPMVARRLVPRATTIRSRALLAETRRVKRVFLRCGTPQELIDDGAGLTLVQPAGYETDGSIVQLVDGLVRGKVLAWVADADDGSFGLHAGAHDERSVKDVRAPTPIDECRVVLSFEDGNAPATVRFGAEGEGGVYGTVEGRPGVFVAPPGLHALMRRIYVSHAALRVDPARVESVMVSAQGKPVFGLDVDAQRVAVGGLYADHVVSLGSTDVGPVDLEVSITVAASDAGAKASKRVICGRVVGLWRRCATPGVPAVFELQPAVVARFLTAPTGDRADAAIRGDSDAAR